MVDNLMSEKSSLMRARPDAETMVVQTREIAELMGLGQWILGVTEHELAARWGISRGAVRQRAAEARRLVQHAYGDTEDLKARIAAQLEGIASETRRKEPRTAVAALLGLATVVGVINRGEMREASIPKRTLSPQEKRVEIAKIRAALDEADAQALAELGGIVDVVPELPSGTPDE